MSVARSQAGIALLLVVWLLALLTVIAGEFMASGRVKAAAEQNKRDDLRGLALALAGYRAARAALDDKLVGLERDADDKLLLYYEGLADGVPAAADDVPLGNGSYSWRIIDEGGLVNINTATPKDLEILLRLCGMEPGAERDTVIDSILDWRDEGREHHLNGAEEDWYRGLDPPYSCKDESFDVVEELLLVRGMTSRLFSGGEVDGKKTLALRDFVSPRIFPRGSPKPTPNPCTAPRALFEAYNLSKSNPCARTIVSPGFFVIFATGKPTGEQDKTPSRSLRAVVRRENAGSGPTFTLVYWNDTYIPE